MVIIQNLMELKILQLNKFWWRYVETARARKGNTSQHSYYKQQSWRNPFLFFVVMTNQASKIHTFYMADGGREYHVKNREK